MKDIFELGYQYLQNFGVESIRGSNYIIYSDKKIPEKHMHNYIEFWDDTYTFEDIKYYYELRIKAKAGFANYCVHGTFTLEKFKDILPYDHLEKIFCCEADINFIDNLKCNEDVIVKKVTKNEKKDLYDILYETSKGYGKRYAVSNAKAISNIATKSTTKVNYYLAYLQDKPIGKIEVSLVDEYIVTENFDILPKYQRQGYGSTLWKQAIIDQKETNINKVMLSCAANDTPKEMYFRKGFKIIGEYSFIRKTIKRDRL